MVVVAIFIAAGYAFAFKNSSSGFSFHEDGGNAFRNTVNGDRGAFVLKEDGREIKAEWRGDYSLDETGTRLGDLDDEFELEIEDDSVSERLEIEKRGDEIVTAYYLDGEEQTDSDRATEAAKALFLKFLRSSGQKAEERVAIIFDNGGVAAVVEELDALESSHALSRYAQGLVEQEKLSTPEINTLISKLEFLESDYDLGQALEAILENQTITAEITPALIKAAGKIESDHDLRKLLEAFAEQAQSDTAFELLLNLYGTIESDYDLRAATTALLENDALTAQQAAQLIAAAGEQIDSDHDLRLVLSESSPFFGKDKTFSEAWFAAYDRLSSSYDQRQALEEIADAAAADEELLNAYRKAARKISSDHDRNEALEAVGDEADG